MSKEAYYFSHDSNAHKDEKIRKLRFKLGLQGYGAYWILIELLRDDPCFELEKDYESIAFELHTQCEIIKSIVEDFGLFEVNKTHFWSNSLKERMAIKEAKSEKARQSALKRWGKKENIEVVDTEEVNANALQTQSDGNAIKGKEKKENTFYYTDEHHFLSDWKKIREHLERKPTNIKKLARDELLNFNILKKEFTIKEFQDAMKGLFNQKQLFEPSKLRPRHFLQDRNIEKYLDAFNNKIQLYQTKKERL